MTLEHIDFRGTMSVSPAHLLTSHEVAEVFGVSLRTVQSWRHRGTGPRSTRVRGVYAIEDVLAWAEEARRPIRVDPIDIIRKGNE